MPGTIRVLFDDSLAGNPAGTGTYSRGVFQALRRLDGIELIPAGWAGRQQQLDVAGKGAGRLRNGLDRINYYLRVLPNRATRSGADVVFCPLPAAPLFGRTPAVMTVFDLSVELYPQTFDPLSRIYATWLLRAGLRRCAQACVISEAVRAELASRHQFPPRRIHVAYPGPSPELMASEPAPALADDAAFLLMVGTLEPRKNHVTALRAFAAYRGRHPDSNLRLVLAGSPGWRYQPVLDEIERLSLSAQVIRLGPTSFQRLKWLYQHAGGLLFPSIYEGFGLPVLDAMLLGCPVAAAGIPPVLEITGSDGTRLLDPMDVDAWSDAIEQLALGHDVEGRRRAQQRAQRFTWQACAEAIQAALALTVA